MKCVNFEETRKSSIDLLSQLVIPYGGVLSRVLAHSV